MTLTARGYLGAVGAVDPSARHEAAGDEGGTAGGADRRAGVEPEGLGGWQPVNYGFNAHA